MIVFLDIREPQERAIARRQLGKLTAHRVVWCGGHHLGRSVAEPIEPRHLSFCAPPSIGHEVPRNPEQVAAQVFIAELSDIRAQQAAEGILHDVIRIARVTCDAIDVRPQRARRALVEPREFDLIQRATYAERAISFEVESCACPLISPIRRDSLSET